MGIENLDKKYSLKIEAMYKNNCISGIYLDNDETFTE